MGLTALVFCLIFDAHYKTKNDEKIADPAHIDIFRTRGQ